MLLLVLKLIQFIASVRLCVYDVIWNSSSA